MSVLSSYGQDQAQTPAPTSRSWTPWLTGGSGCAWAQSTHLGFLGEVERSLAPASPMAFSRGAGQLPATFVKSSPSFAADTTSHHSGADGVCVML